MNTFPSIKYNSYFTLSDKNSRMNNNNNNIINNNIVSLSS